MIVGQNFLKPANQKHDPESNEKYSTQLKKAVSICISQTWHYFKHDSWVLYNDQIDHNNVVKDN